MDSLKQFYNESGSSIVEYVIIFPFVIVVVYMLLFSCLVIHDRSTLDGAVSRGAIYAAHCISDPNYSDIVHNSQGSGEIGELDLDYNLTSFSFSQIGKNIHVYGLLKGNADREIEQDVKDTVLKIVEKTRIPWKDIDIDSVNVSVTNKLYYKEVTVSAGATYPLPKLFGAFGLPTDFSYEVSATSLINDPDEFIRNADLVVDLIASVDQKTGGTIEKAIKKLEELSTKLIQWLKF